MYNNLALAIINYYIISNKPGNKKFWCTTDNVYFPSFNNVFTVYIADHQADRKQVINNNIAYVMLNIVIGR